MSSRIFKKLRRYGIFAIVGTFLMVMTSFHALASGYSTTIPLDNLPFDVYLPGGITTVNIVNVHKTTTLLVRINNNHEDTDFNINGISIGQLNPYGDDVIVFQIDGPTTINFNPSMWTYLHIEKKTLSSFIVPPIRIIGKLYPGFGSQSGIEINLVHRYPWLTTEINGTASSNLEYRAFVNGKISDIGKFENDQANELNGSVDKFQLLGSVGTSFSLDIVDNWPQYRNQMTYSVGTVNVTAKSSGNSNVLSILKTETVVKTDIFVSSSDIVFSDDHPIAGDNVTISTKVYSGLAAINQTVVRFYDGSPSSDNQIGTDKLINFIGQPNFDYRSADVNVTWQAKPGTHDIYIVVDPRNDILEEYRDDNTAVASIHVAFPFQIQKNDGTPLSKLTSYIFSTSDQYLGISGISDIKGKILFDLDQGEYKIATDYLGIRYFTNVISIPQTRNYTLQIDHQDTIVTVYGNYSGIIEPVPNVPVYLFSADSSYLGLNGYTDTTGNVTFNIPKETFKFRSDYLNKNYWSTASQNERVEIEIPLGMVTLNVSNSVSLTNIPVYIFDSNKQFIGIDKFTNSTGCVTFTLPEGEYKFRADAFGSQYFSDLIIVNHDIIKYVDFKVGGGLLTLNVSTQNGLPIQNIPIYAFSDQGQYIGKNDFTNSTGAVSFDLPSGNYKFRADFLGYSFFSSTTSPPNVIDFKINIYNLEVTITDGSAPLSNIPIYLFRGDSYLGTNCYSNSSGKCSLLMTNQTYRFRYDYMDNQYWSEEFSISSNSHMEKVIQHKVITVTATEKFQGVGIPIANAPVYLFTTDNNYLGKYNYTNGTGLATFNVPSNIFKFRLDFLGESYWSDPILWQDVVITVNIGKISVQIMNNTIQKNGIPVYAFLSNGQYTGIFNYTNSSGLCEFILPVNAYLFRADFGGIYHWSNIINVSQDAILIIPVGDISRSSSRATDLTVQLKKDESIPIQNVPIFAFRISDGTYTGYFAFTNSQGIAVINLPDGDYNFRADYLGYSFFSRDVSIPSENSLTWIIPHKEIILTFNSNYHTSFEGLPVYAFTSPHSSYIGECQYLSAINSAMFYLPEGDFKFRLDYLGLQIWTSETNWQNVTTTIDEGILNVTVMQGKTPVSNVPIYLFDSNQNYLGKNGISSSDGTVEFNLPIQNYQFRADVDGTQFFSDPVTPQKNTIDTITIQTGGGDLVIHLIDQNRNPIPHVPIYIFSMNGQYLGLYSISDEFGIATLKISSGVYNIRTDYLGQNFWKNQVPVGFDNNGVYSYDFIIEHQSINVHVGSSFTLSEGEYLMPIPNVPVYVFTENGEYIGEYNITDDYGTVAFDLPSCPFKFRADYLGESYWSDIIVPDGMSEATINIPMNWVMISFYDENIDQFGGSERAPISDIPIYIFDGSNYLGLVQATDQGGFTYFQLPVRELTARADYNGKQYWSEPFMVDPETFTTVDISAASDLAITSFDINAPSNVLEGDTVTLNATIHSLGSLTANSVSVKFYMDSESNLIGETTVDITAGSSQQALVPWVVPFEKGFHNIIVKIDGDNQIAETNENNNEANITLRIRQPYDVQLSSDYPLREFVTPETIGNYIITVTNDGYYTDTIQLILSKPDAPWFAILNKTSVTLRSGQSTTVQLTVYPDSDGDGINNYFEQTSDYMAGFSYLNTGISSSTDTKITNIDLTDQIHQMKIRTNLTIPSNVNYDVLDLKSLVKFSLTSDTYPNVDLVDSVEKSVVYHDSEVSLNIIYRFNISGNGNYDLSASVDQKFLDIITDYSLVVKDVTLYGTGLNPYDQDTDHDGIPDKKEIELGLSPINPDTDGDGIWDGAELNYWQSRGYTLKESVLLALIPDRDNDGLNDGVELAKYFTDPDNKDSDWDSLLDGDEVNIYHTDPMNPDTDNDGLPDGWEVKYHFDPTDPADAGMDKDNDGLNNLLEYQYGTNPHSKDTDKDGLNDGDELMMAETDGIPNKFRTDPTKSDTDGDGIPDGWEVLNNLDPTDPSDGSKDQDNDGLTALEEYFNNTNPWLPDTDGDTLLDGKEVNIYHTDPTKKDTDGDGLTDDIEVQPGSVTDPLKADTDGDGLPDGWIDYNNNGIKDLGEYEDRNLNGIVDAGVWNNGNGPGETDPSLADSDRDGMPDGWEVKHNLNPLFDDSQADPDNDGLTNIEEYKHNSDPHNKDTDGDGLTDGAEVNGHPATDPTNPDTDGDGLWDGMNIVSPVAPFQVLHYGEMTYRTDPTKADTDGDKLSDYDEVMNYFKYDRIETEDLSPMVTNPVTTSIHQFDVTMSVSNLKAPATSLAILSSSNSPETMIRADQIKNYQIYMSGGGNVLVAGIAPNVNRDFVHQAMNSVLENAANFVVYVPGQPGVQILTSSPPTKISHLTYNNDDPTEYPFIPHSGSQELNDASYHWIQKYQYNLMAGNNYPVEINVNYILLNNLYQQTVDGLVGCNWGQGCAHEGSLVWVNITIDYFYVEKLGLDPLNKDTDGDTLLDGWEIENNTFPFSADPDKDGISDPRELQLGTNPEDRDTDHDGLRDSIEIGNTGQNIDPYTTYDTDPRNIDADTTITTDPLNPDSDHDNIPDGWIDGWGTNHVPSANWTFSKGAGKTDMVKQRSEGEDLNCNGKVDTGDWASGAGETDPNSADTDGDKMPDYFEVHYYETDGILNPLVNDASNDADNDGRTNLEEFVVDTHPNMKDTDKDGLNDYKETEVRFRTNVPDGALSILNYGTINAKNEYEWVWFVNPQGIGAEYGYYGKDIDPQRDSYGGFGGYNPVQYTLQDGSSIIYNKTEKRIYIWIPGSDYMDKNKDGVLHGTVHIFAVSSAQDPGQAETSSDPKVDFKNQELYIANPFNKDTDGDGMPDGLESLYNVDSDGDGLINIRDTDSDNDGIPDGQEVPFAPYSWDLDVDRDGIPNMLDLDSDNDGIPDSIEYKMAKNPDGDPFPNWLDWDSDNDGLPDGWVKDSIYGYVGPFPDYTNQLIQIGNGDNVRDPFEGEDLNCNGIQDPGETNMTISDSDNDGLTDGYSYIDDYGNQQIGELTVGTDPLNPDCDHDGLLDGQEVKGWTIVVEDVNQVKTTKHVTSDPWKADTDNDGMPDLLEYQFTDPREPDTDHDGLSDKVEDKNHNGKWDAGETNPLDADTDNDHLTDGIELDASDGFTTDPLNWDTDGDHLPDGWVDGWGYCYGHWGVCHTQDGIRQIGEYEDYNLDGNWDYGPTVANDETNPAKGYADSDFDGLDDRTEMMIYQSAVDWGNDNNQWLEWTSDVNRNGYDNWVDPDSDGDGIPDGLELLPNTDYNNNGLSTVLDAKSAKSASNLDDKTDLEHIYVSFRTNAKDTNNDGQFEFSRGTWIAINRNVNPNDIAASRSGSLTYYTYSCRYCGAPSNEYNILTKAMDGSAIYWDSGASSSVYVKLSDGSYVKYAINNNVPSNVPLSINPVLSYGLANQERWGGENYANPSADDDHDGLSNDEETVKGTTKTDGDTDDDGISDGQEVHSLGTDPNCIDCDNDYSYYGLPADKAGDGVQDGTEIGLTTGVESQNQVIGLLWIETSGTDTSKFVPDADPTTKTDPHKIDTDGDGLPDGWIDGWTYNYARQEWGYDSTKVDGVMQPWEGEDFPLQGEKYGNGKFDKDRTDGIHETDPTKMDTDGDGLPDGLEAFYHGDPNDPTDADKDLDHDGLTLREEIAAGTFADNWDSDGDGLPDGWEVYYGYNPRLADSNYDRDGDGLTGLQEYKIGMPAGWNSAVDGVWWGGSNASNPDTDGDGVPDGYEYHVGDATYNDADKDGILNIFDTDSDNDGVPDGVEYKGWDISYTDKFNKKIYMHVTSDPYKADTDSDGLTDDKELKYGTNPSSSDTDGDKNPYNTGPELGDYWEACLGDPRFAENTQPWFAGKPEMDWQNVADAVTIKFKAYDNAGISMVIGKLYHDQVVSDELIDYPVGYPTTVEETMQLWLDGPVTAVDGFMIEITVIDINNNVNSEYRQGGIIHDIQSPIAKFFGAFSPEVAGGITGYYEGFLQSAWDMSIGMIPWDQLFSLMNQENEKAQNEKDKVYEKTKYLRYTPKSPNDPCAGKNWFDALMCQTTQSIIKKSDRANPFDSIQEQDKYYKFQRAYGTAYIIGYAVFFIISLCYGGGEARAAEEGATAAVDAGKLAAQTGERAEEETMSSMADLTRNADTAMDAGTDVEAGAAGFSDIDSSSRVLTDPAYKDVPKDEKVEIAKFEEEHPEFREEFPGQADDAMIIGCKQCPIDKKLDGLAKLEKSGMSKDELKALEESEDPGVQKALKYIGESSNSNILWDSESLNSLTKTFKFYESSPNVLQYIEDLKDVKGIDDTITALTYQFGDTPELTEKLTGAREGIENQLKVASTQFDPEEIDVLDLKTGYGPGETDIDIKMKDGTCNEVKSGPYSNYGKTLVDQGVDKTQWGKIKRYGEYIKKTQNGNGEIVIWIEDESNNIKNTENLINEHYPDGTYQGIPIQVKVY